MRLNATYRGGDDPFEGDRVVELRALPAGALVQRATLTVTPTNAAPAAPRAPFEEHFAFGTARAGELAAADWGVTATPVNQSVEVDLRARRTLAAVAGTRIAGSTLTVDVGGLYVELNENGAVRAPGDGAFPMLASGALPGVTVPGFRLTGNGGRPAVDTLVVRSGPANVTISLGGLAPVWTYVGDLATTETTPDFAETLRAFLLESEVRDGAYVIPFVVHADGVARLDLTLELEYLLGASLLPAGVAEAVLPFDLSSFARSGSAALSVRLPPGAEVVPGATRARVHGAFEPTRIAAEAGTDELPPPAGTTVTADRAAAQALEPAGGDVLVTGFDLFLAPLGASARLAVSLLADSDGKPFGDPLLRAPLEVVLSREQGRAATWTTVALSEAFHLERGRRYWLVLQGLEGETSWGAAAAGATAVPLQASGDGGLSWSDATDAQRPGPLTALHRLRVTPDRFTMPIAVDVGSEHVTLEEFEPLNRVDFTVDTPKLAQAFEAAIVATGTKACPIREHLANAGLDDWIGVGDEFSFGESVELEGSPRALALTADGRHAHVASVAAAIGEVRLLLETVPLACGAALEPVVVETNEVSTADPVMVVLSPAGDRAYVVSESDGDVFLAIVDLAARARIGEIVDLDPIRGLAVAPDGERLFLLRQAGAAVAIDAIDARAIERVAVEITDLNAELTPVALVTPPAGEQVVPHIPAALVAARAGGETLLAFAVEAIADSSPGAGHLMLLTEERPQDVESVAVGAGTRALAVTADGLRIVAVCEGDQTLRVVATGAQAGTPAASIALDTVPVAVAVSADGRRAAVVSRTDLAVYDLDDRRRVARKPVGLNAVAVAGSARLDVLLVAPSLGASLARLSTDAVPVDWVLTSGFVEPRCFGSDLGALLGRRRFRRRLAAGQEPEPRVPSAISQVVAVSGGCRYAFGFTGLADQPASAGEVLWRAGDCGLERADRVPIAEPEPRADDDGEPVEPKLVSHGVTVEAPPGTSQAEVRFTVPIGGRAAIASVSLRGSDTVGPDGAAGEPADDALGGWAAEPGGAVLSTQAAAGASGVRIANETAVAGALVQSFAVAPGRPLEIELAGRVIAGGGDPGPALVLRLLDEHDAPVGEPVAVALARHAFDQLLIGADVPAGASRAELRLTLPAGAAVELDRVAPRQPSDVDVPVVFRAEAPGELAVSTADVVYDVRPAPAPALPATGGCTPTAPGRVPGAEPEHGRCCCADHERHEAKDRIVQGLPERMHARGAGMPPDGARAAHAVIAVSGIGAVRARRLALVGIPTAERLAVADPRVVAAVLGGMSSSAARRLIDSARQLVSQPLPR